MLAKKETKVSKVCKTKKNSITTSKKTKIVGEKDYIDPVTGELQTMNVISVENRDFNFHKIWLGHIIQCLDLIGNKKIKVINFILENINYENKLCMSRRVISEKSGVCLRTVQETMQSLMKINLVQMHGLGVYRINPNMIFKGEHKQRMNILIEYKKEETRNKSKIKVVK